VLALGTATRISLEPLIPHHGAPVAEVYAQGLPNLLHECTHIVLAEVLDHDHGIDYGAIPFNLETATGRQVLWDELSCCVVSCAYLCVAPTSVDAWFAEQLEIQPVFYGMEGDPTRFVHTVGCLLRMYPSEFESTLARAYRRLEALLQWIGAPPDLARPARRWDALALMARQGWSSPETWAPAGPS